MYLSVLYSWLKKSRGAGRMVNIKRLLWAEHVAMIWKLVSWCILLENSHLENRWSRWATLRQVMMVVAG
jgi:hypothetical protein